MRKYRHILRVACRTYIDVPLEALNGLNHCCFFTLASKQLLADNCSWEDRLKTSVPGEVFSSLASATFSIERKRVRIGMIIRLKRPLSATV